MRGDKVFPHPEIVGQFRQFGPFGPFYEVLEVTGMDDKKGWMLKIRVLETSEELAYPYEKLNRDPLVH